MQIQVKQSYKGKNISSLYRVLFVYSRRPNIGPADYWSLTLHPVEYSDGYIHSEYLGVVLNVVHPVEYSDGYIGCSSASALHIRGRYYSSERTKKSRKAHQRVF